jgi:hypothetical protein
VGLAAAGDKVAADVRQSDASRIERAFEKRTHGHRPKRQRVLDQVIKKLASVASQLSPKQVRWLGAGGQILRSFTPHRVRNRLVISSARKVGSTGAVPVG